ATVTAATGQAGIAEMITAEAGVHMTAGDQPPTNATAAAGVVSGGPDRVAASRSMGEPRRNGAGEGSARYSPAVLTLAAEHNLDLSQIPGSGMGGRVTRKDVIQFLERGAPAAPAAAVAIAPAAPPAQPAPPTQAAPPT